MLSEPSHGIKKKKGANCKIELHPIEDKIDILHETNEYVKWVWLESKGAAPLSPPPSTGVWS